MRKNLLVSITDNIKTKDLQQNYRTLITEQNSPQKRQENITDRATINVAFGIDKSNKYLLSYK